MIFNVAYDKAANPPELPWCVSGGMRIWLAKKLYADLFAAAMNLGFTYEEAQQIVRDSPDLEAR